MGNFQKINVEMSRRHKSLNYLGYKSAENPPENTFIRSGSRVKTTPVFGPPNPTFLSPLYDDK